MYKLFRHLHIPSKNVINVSENAWSKMHSIYHKTTQNTFLFSASSGGCSGLNYNFKNVSPSLITEMGDGTKMPISFLDNANGGERVRVYVEPMSEMYLLGTTIDYIAEDYANGVYESKFTFNPDSAKAGTCGCGVSFYIKE